jgi:hypothetical protein
MSIMNSRSAPSWIVKHPRSDFRSGIIPPEFPTGEEATGARGHAPPSVPVAQDPPLNARLLLPQAHRGNKFQERRIGCGLSSVGTKDAGVVDDAKVRLDGRGVHRLDGVAVRPSPPNREFAVPSRCRHQRGPAKAARLPRSALRPSETLLAAPTE